MRRKLAVAVMLVVAALLIGACAKEVVKEVPVEKVIEKEVVKEVPVEKVVEKEVVKEVLVEKVVEKEVALNLPETAQKIATGEIDVGKEFGLEPGKRYHTIHADTLGLECTTCHISKYAPDYPYQRKYKVPVHGAPGPVDRGVCLGCHKENGPAKTKLYGTAGD